MDYGLRIMDDECLCQPVDLQPVTCEPVTCELIPTFQPQRLQ